MDDFIQKLKETYPPYKNLEGDALYEVIFATKPGSGACGKCFLFRCDRFFLTPLFSIQALGIVRHCAQFEIRAYFRRCNHPRCLSIRYLAFLCIYEIEDRSDWKYRTYRSRVDSVDMYAVIHIYDNRVAGGSWIPHLSRRGAQGKGDEQK